MERRGALWSSVSRLARRCRFFLFSSRTTLTERWHWHSASLRLFFHSRLSLLFRVYYTPYILEPTSLWLSPSIGRVTGQGECIHQRVTRLNWTEKASYKQAGMMNRHIKWLERIDWPLSARCWQLKKTLSSWSEKTAQKSDRAREWRQRHWQLEMERIDTFFCCVPPI